jgi:hypothetical protein
MKERRANPVLQPADSRWAGFGSALHTITHLSLCSMASASASVGSFSSTAAAGDLSARERTGTPFLCILLAMAAVK